jgi:hypothetical protein
MSDFLSPQAFRTLRFEGVDTDRLDPAAPGAVKFITDLAEDIVALLPDLPGVYVDPFLTRSVDERYGELYCRKIVPRLLDQTMPVPVFFGPGLDMRGECSSRADFFSDPPDLISIGSRPDLPPTVEIDLGSMRQPEDGRGGAPDRDIGRSVALRKKFEAFAGEVRGSWELIRSASEKSMLSPLLGYGPLPKLSVLTRSIEGLKSSLLRLNRFAEEAASLIEPCLVPGTLERWTSSKIDPIREGISRLEACSRQVTSWIETE